MYWNRENRVEIRNVWLMTKKRSSEISADENEEICREKVKLWKFSSEPENFSKIGGKSETGGMHHGLRGMDAHSVSVCLPLSLFLCLNLFLLKDTESVYSPQ